MRVLRRAWEAPLWAHAAVLAVVLLIVFPFMSPDSAFTSDEGAYALQARALEQGSWEYDYQAADLDPEGKYFPVVLSSRAGDSFFTYIQHPAYPLLLGGAEAVAGRTLGLHLLPLLGVVGAAVAAWLLAGQMAGTTKGLSRAAFWVVAGSPVVVNGYMLWAHAPSAAVAGLTLVAALRVARDGLRSWAAAGLVAGACAGVLLRSEGLLFALALAVALAVARKRAAGLSAALTSLAVVAGSAVGVAVAERQWVRSIVGPGYENLQLRGGDGGGGGSFLAERWSGAWHELAGGFSGEPAAGLLALAAAGIAGGLAFLALRRWGPRSHRDIRVAVVVAVVLYAIRLVLYPTDAITGLLVAWPLAVIGLALFPWRRRDPPAVVLAVTLGLFTLAVLATQYPNGGGLEWGGRFFSPVIVPIAVMAVVGIGRHLAKAPDLARRQATGLLAALAVTTAVVALVSVGSLRARHDRIVEAAAQPRSPVIVTTIAALPRVAWRAGDVSWMLTDNERLPELLASLREQGVAEVGVLLPSGTEPPAEPAYPQSREVAGPELEGVGMRLHVYSS